MQYTIIHHALALLTITTLISTCWGHDGEFLEFWGTALTNLDYYSADNWPGPAPFVRSSQSQYNVDVFIQHPNHSRDGFQVETNPFSLDIFSERDAWSDDEGFITIRSAAVYTGFETPGDLVLQYWDFDYIGSTVSGELVDTHVQESVAWNLLSAYDLNMEKVGIDMVLIEPMAVGTTIQGTATDNEIRLTIAGTNSNTFTHFNTNIVANRVL